MFKKRKWRHRQKKRTVPRVTKRGINRNLVDIVYWSVVLIVFSALFLPILMDVGVGASTVTAVLSSLLWAIYSRYRKERKLKEGLSEKVLGLETKISELEEQKFILTKTISHQSGIETAQRNRINDAIKIEEKLRSEIKILVDKINNQNC